MIKDIITDGQEVLSRPPAASTVRIHIWAKAISGIPLSLKRPTFHVATGGRIRAIKSRRQPQKRENHMSKEDDNKTIIGRWFTNFWGKT